MGPQEARPVTFECPEDMPRIRVVTDHDAPVEIQRVTALPWLLKVFEQGAVTAGAVSGLPVDNPHALALYVVLAGHAAHRLGGPLPSTAGTGPLGWTGDLGRDAELVLALYHSGLLAIAPETPVEAFRLYRDGHALSFAVPEVLWRTVGGPSVVAERVAEIEFRLQTEPGATGAEARRAVAALLEQMEIANVVAYLDGLLARKHFCAEVPEARREELVGVVRKGLTHGYTPGQMISLAWRAVASAVAWRERLPQVGPDAVASAAVTALSGKLGAALEFRQPIPEYEPPRWHRAPLALPGLRRLAAGIRRVYDREVVDACVYCDQQGLTETFQSATGAEVVWRCVHPVDRR